MEEERQQQQYEDRHTAAGEENANVVAAVEEKQQVIEIATEEEGEQQQQGEGDGDDDCRAADCRGAAAVAREKAAAEAEMMAALAEVARGFILTLKMAEEARLLSNLAVEAAARARRMHQQAEADREALAEEVANFIGRCLLLVFTTGFLLWLWLP